MRSAEAFSSRLPIDFHLLVHDPAALDHDFSIEGDGAVAHRHVVMAARIALAAALRVGTGGKEEIPGERPRSGAMALRVVAVECDAVPEGLRIHAPAEVR